MSLIQLYDKYLIIISSKPMFRSNPFFRYRDTSYAQQKKQYNQTKPPIASVPLGQERMFVYVSYTMFLFLCMPVKDLLSKV